MKYQKITISGKICTGKSSLFKKLAGRLKWATFSTGQYFRDYAKKYGLNLEKAEEQNEKLTKKVDFYVRNLLHKPGHLIVEGWMSGIIANKIPDVLRILLIADDRVRYKRFAQREKISQEEAKKKVEEREQSWIKRLKKIYHRSDFFDPKNYNFVIGTTNLTKEQVFKLVLKKLRN